MYTSNLCPPFGVYYGAQSGTEACIDGACCAGGGFTCICMMCTQDSDCPACANNVVPKCENGRCVCKPCISNSNCISGYCCDADGAILPADEGSGNCLSEGTIYKGKYLCDPPAWSNEKAIQSFNSSKPKIFNLGMILNFFAKLFKI